MELEIESEESETKTLGQHLPQLEQRMNLTWPRPCLLRPPFLRLNVCRERYRSIEQWEK